MGILDYLKSPSFANALGATGATLTALDRGQAPNLAPFRAENQRIGQQQRLDAFRDRLPGILPNATPQQMGILSEMLGMGGRPSGAAMQGILGQVFPEAGDPFERFRVVPGVGLADLAAQGGPAVVPGMAAPQDAPEAPSIIREAQALFPNDPAAQRKYVTDYRQRSGVTVNTGNSAPQVGTIPQGYELRQTESGWQMAPIPGGPAAAEAGQAQQTAETRQGNASTSADVITTAADRALKAGKNLDFGPVGTSVVGQLPWTDSAEVLRNVDVLKSNATVENLNAMRRESKTGGALGNVTEKEGAMLAARSGALDPNSPTFARDLKDYVRTLLRIVHGKEAGDEAFQKWSGGDQGGAPASPSMPISDEELMKALGL